MSTIKCVLIDDESNAITALAYEIQRVQEPETSLLASFTNARDAVDYLLSPSGNEVDVIFLDIEMPGLDGLALLDAFPHRGFEVIFTTAHKRYAIDAIRKSAFDYLVKPVDLDELRCALERLAERSDKMEDNEQLAPSEIQSFHENAHRIRFEVDRKILFVEPDEIIYCEADGNYCRVLLENDKSLFLTRQLKAVGLLLPRQFVRTHKSYIVNRDKIREYHRAERCLVLSNGKQIPVSKLMHRFFVNGLAF